MVSPLQGCAMMRDTDMFNHLSLFVIILLMAGCAHTPPALANSNAEQAVQKAVESFCQMEYEGDREPRRIETIQYSAKEAARRQQQREPLPVYSLFFDQDPLFVVASYQIVSVRVKASGNRATAVVKYRRIARSEGATQDTWHLVTETPRDEMVTLNLLLSKNRWLVLDSPSPHVSKTPLIQFYESQLKEGTPTWEQELNDPSYDDEQKARVRAIRERVTGTLQILKSLP